MRLGMMQSCFFAYVGYLALMSAFWHSLSFSFTQDPGGAEMIRIVQGCAVVSG